MFVNTRYFSPVPLEGLTTAPEDSYEWHEWWREQERRCVEGYSVGGTRITGPHYYYLNFTKILASTGKGGGKRRVYPRFLDIDYDFFHEWELCVEEGTDLLYFKRRQIGATYKSSGLASWYLSFVPDSVSVITSGEEAYSLNSYKRAKQVLDELAELGPEFYKERNPNSATEHMKAVFKEKLPNGTMLTTGFQSEIIRKTTTNPQSLAGLTLTCLIYEEGGKFAGIIAAKEYNDAMMREGDMKTGTSLVIATGGEEHTSVHEIEKMMYDPQTYGFRSYENIWDEDDAPMDDVRGSLKKVGFFVPGDRFYKTDEDGNSLIEESRKLILEDRAKVSKDRKLLNIRITQFPLTIAEGLMRPAGGRFNALKLQEVKAYILKYGLDKETRIGDIEWDRDDQGNITGASWTDNPVSGIYRMTEPPYVDERTRKVPQGLYVAGTDSYDRDKAADLERGSKGAIRIHKGFQGIDAVNDVPVCGMIQRPDTAEEFYENTAKLLAFYGWAMNLIEYSNILIFDWYDKHNFSNLLAGRPEIAYANIANSKVQNRRGVDPASKPAWETIGESWIEQHYMKLRDIQLIDKLIRYNSEENCDETIAFLLSLVHARERIHIASRPKPRPVVLPRYAMKDGRMVRLY